MGMTMSHEFVSISPWWMLVC